jgi:MFS family permease
MFLPFSLLFFLATTSLPLTRIGLALSAAALVRIPVTIAAGPLSDRFGPRAVIVASQLLQAAGFGGYLLVRGFWPLAVCEAIQAAVVPTVVTESATPQTVGRYTSAYQVTFSIGDILVPVIVTAALDVGAAALWLPLSGWRSSTWPRWRCWPGG